jgi:putative SOS response-associated peptidase YedK
MCGRFTRYYTWEQIWQMYNLSVPAGSIPNLRPRYNVCPTDPVDVVLPGEDGRKYQEMRWGLVPYWWSKPLKELRVASFNARVETVVTKPFFRDAFKKRRCLMPVSGYYEWQATPEGKQPHYFTARDGSPVLTVAALWDEWKDRANPDKPFRSCTMIITQPNDFVAEVHDRMPALLRPDQIEGWLSGAMSAEDLRPVDNDYLQRVPVSKRVNSSKADDNDPSLITGI